MSVSKQDTIERLRGLVSAGQRAQAAVDATIAALEPLLARLERMAAAAIADGELGPWSTGEQLAVCLVLDRHDWLQHLGYTMLEATERVGGEWLQACRTLQGRGVQLNLPR
jgi:hypothetical protein